MTTQLSVDLTPYQRAMLELTIPEALDRAARTWPDRPALHFLESGLVGRSAPSPKRLARAAEQVNAVSDGIRAGDFAPNASPMRCGFCAFREICPDAAR